MDLIVNHLCSVDTAYFLRVDFRISGRLHRQSIFLLIYTNIIFLDWAWKCIKPCQIQAYPLWHVSYALVLNCQSTGALDAFSAEWKVRLIPYETWGAGRTGAKHTLLKLLCLLLWPALPKTYHLDGFNQEAFISHSCGDQEVKDHSIQCGSLSGYSHTIGDASGLYFASRVKTLIPFMKLHPQKPKVPTSPPPNTISVGISISEYEFEKDTKIQLLVEAKHKIR